MWRSILVHLRIPFSWNLAAVPLFAAVQVSTLDVFNTGLVFSILLLCLYPASHAFNSYYDRDQYSIGGVECPPQVAPLLFWVALAFDLLALILGSLMSSTFMCLLLTYGLASKAYSHPLIRLKKRPLLSFAVVFLFQGGLTYLMSLHGLTRTPLLKLLSESQQWQNMALCSLWIGAGYPLSQVFQHQEDKERGDQTLSLLLGVRGTFIFSGCLFFITQGVLFKVSERTFFWQAQTLMFPIGAYFLWWAFRCFNNEVYANFKYSHRMNRLTSNILNLGLILKIINAQTY
jgi:1,4-dihydroxy-2-naphthoate octaprenyltransferase